MSITRKELGERAAYWGLDVFVWSPGDGRSRYRFVRAGQSRHYDQDFGYATVSGLSAAEDWLNGWIAGIRATEADGVTSPWRRRG